MVLRYHAERVPVAGSMLRLGRLRVCVYPGSVAITSVTMTVRMPICGARHMRVQTMLMC